jgi:hypothetical protein
LVAEIGVQIFSFTQLWKLKRAILKLSNTLVCLSWLGPAQDFYNEERIKPLTSSAELKAMSPLHPFALAVSPAKKRFST